MARGGGNTEQAHHSARARTNPSPCFSMRARIKHLISSCASPALHLYTTTTKTARRWFASKVPCAAPSHCKSVQNFVRQRIIQPGRLKTNLEDVAPGRMHTCELMLLIAIAADMAQERLGSLFNGTPAYPDETAVSVRLIGPPCHTLADWEAHHCGRDAHASQKNIAERSPAPPLLLLSPQLLLSSQRSLRPNRSAYRHGAHGVHGKDYLSTLAG